MAMSGKPGSFGDELRRAIERLAILQTESMVTAHRENVVASPAASVLSAGAN